MTSFHHVNSEKNGDGFYNFLSLVNSTIRVGLLAALQVSLCDIRIY